MESVEVSAKSVEEAIQQALIRLGRERDEVEVTILNEGHRGILGFVRGDSARVKVTVLKPGQTAAPSRGSGPAARPAPARPAAPRPAAPPPAAVSQPESPEVAQPGEAATVAQEALEDLLDHMGIPANVIYKGGQGDEDSPILLDVIGRDLGILIGRRGETLASMQFLLNLMAGKRLDSWVRVSLDVEGYRARREEALRSLAARVAERVRRTGQPVALEPMPPNERRIVHIALQDSPYVTTESSGYGEDRRITVLPKSRVRSGSGY